ncbi:hypothetical protein FJZ31_07045 [Candidatus Poribacteria bacterium]|nr:hypothetical protein [Candidatus Poribacteria bacterium]
MEREDFEETKIVMGKDKIITRKKLYEYKAYFHKEQAHLPFEEKIKILVKLQEIASRIKRNDKIIWNIYQEGN